MLFMPPESQMELKMASTSDRKKIALNVYLLKKRDDGSPCANWAKTEFLARPVGSSGKALLIRTDEYPLGTSGEYGTLYIKKPATESEPEWVQFVSSGVTGSTKLPKLKNRSTSAILVIERNSRQFVIAFGHGRFMIEPRLVEDRFGIRTVLNSISPEKVASIDRQTFDASPRISRVQTVKASSVSDFMINPEQDLLRGLVGFTQRSYRDSLGDVVAGIDSFKASIGIVLSELPGVLDVILERSESTDYLKRDSEGRISQFAWVENLLPIKDRSKIENLEKALWKKLKAPTLENMWLSVPEIFDWSEVTGFRYGTTDKGEIESDLDLKEFMSTLRKGATIETIKRKEIIMQMSSGIPSRRINAFKCIYAEIKLGIDLFILHAGTWFKVEDNFKRGIEKYFSSLPRRAMSAPFIEYNHSGEGDYNEAVCAADPTQYGILDRKLIQFGGKHDKIEVCDIIKTSNSGTNRSYDFFHVKRGRSSANLSHLFAQGLVAATLLVREESFTTDVNAQLTNLGLPSLPSPFSARGNNLVYAIIDGPSTSTLDIPFFSKVTLQNCGKTISAFGYSVALMHIPESATYLAAKAKKSAKKKATKKTVKKAVKSTVKKAAKKAVKKAAKKTQRAQQLNQ